MEASDTEIAKQFIGSWSLVSWIATRPDGTTFHPYDENPVGRIMYQDTGKMVACLMRRERIPFASDNRHAASPTEQKAAYKDFVSYFGSFTIQEAEGTVTHHVEGSTFPNWIGTDLVRSYHFAGNNLTLSLTSPSGVLNQLTWERH